MPSLYPFPFLMIFKSCNNKDIHIVGKHLDYIWLESFCTAIGLGNPPFIAEPSVSELSVQKPGRLMLQADHRPALRKLLKVAEVW